MIRLFDPTFQLAGNGIRAILVEPIWSVSQERDRMLQRRTLVGPAPFAVTVANGKDATSTSFRVAIPDTKEERIRVKTYSADSK